MAVRAIHGGQGAAPAATGGGGRGGARSGNGCGAAVTRRRAQGTSATSPHPPVEDDYDEQLERMKTSKSGTGEEETGASARNKAFKDDFRNLWKDTARAGADIRDRKGDTYAEKESNLEANLINLQLFPVSALITTLGRLAALGRRPVRRRAQADGDPVGARGDIPRPRHHDAPRRQRPRRQSRDPALVGRERGLEVVKTERMVKEALDAPGAEVSEAESALAKAQHAKNPDQARIDELQKQVELKRLEATGDPLELLDKKIELKELELVDVKKRTEGWPSGRSSRSRTSSTCSRTAATSTCSRSRAARRRRHRRSADPPQRDAHQRGHRPDLPAA